MSNFTEFVTIVSGILNTVVDCTLVLCFGVIVIAIVITELIKVFNPNIETSKQALEYIVAEIKEEGNDEEESEEEDNPIFDRNSPYLVFLLMPMIGAFVIIAILTPLFPVHAAEWLDIVIKYYISVLPYFAILVALYFLGLMSSRVIIWGARKTFDLATSTMKIIKEEKEDE